MVNLGIFPRIWHYWKNNRNYLSLRKIINIIGINMQMVLRISRVIGYPYIVKIEPSNICNSNCALCPTGMGLISRAKGKIKFDEFKKVVDKLKPWIYVLDLSNWGEPLIHADIYKMVRYANENKIFTTISSNLHAFKYNDTEELIASRLDELIISIHASSSETYQIYQKGKNFNDVIEKIKHIVKVKKQLNRNKPKIYFNFVVTKYNEHEIPQIQKLANELEIGYSLSKASLNLRFIGLDKSLRPLGISKEKRNQLMKEKMDKWLPGNEDFIQDNYLHLKEGNSKHQNHLLPCDWLWRQTVINWDGNITVCCGIFNKKYDVGNVFNESFKKIWNNKIYRECRDTFGFVKLKKTTNNNIACKNCTGWLP